MSKERIAELVARVDGERLWADLEALARFRDEGAPPYTRLAFGAAYADARRWLEEELEAADLTTRRDAGGSLIGAREGARELPPLVVGSHIDTVDGGGRFDGALGVLAGLEVARVLAEAGHVTEHALELVDFTAEEPNAYGSSCIGSRAWAGTLDQRLLGLTNEAGEPLSAALPRAGGDTGRLADARRAPGSIAAYLELHIEQGPLLEQGGIDVGVVTGIVGIRRVKVVASGRASHAGTTPIDARSDALATAAEIVLSIEQEARTGAGELIGTVGRLHVEPNAPNVVPGRVELSLELRSLDERRLDEALARIAASASRSAEERGVDVAVTPLLQLAAVPADATAVAALEEGARLARATARRLPSWGGHDASQIAAIAPVGMLFAPSRDGISHHADEWTSPEQCETACRVLLAGLLSLDALLARETA